MTAIPRSPRLEYQSSCVDQNCKCNSGVERMLPDAPEEADTVEAVDLSKNLVGAHGFVPLLKALVLLPRLRVLCLANNELDNGSAAALHMGFASHEALVELDLTGNPISHIGGKHLLRLAAASPSLTSIALTGTLVNVALQKRIAATIAERRQPASETAGTAAQQPVEEAPKAATPEPAAPGELAQPEAGEPERAPWTGKPKFRGHQAGASFQHLMSCVEDDEGDFPALAIVADVRRRRTERAKLREERRAQREARRWARYEEEDEEDDEESYDYDEDDDDDY